MFLLKILNLMTLFSVILSKLDKSSLTFVIDNTGSMQDDINLVLQSADLVFDTVTNSNESQIDNFVLVTFNDPDTQLRIKTKNRNQFKDELRSIFVYGGDDCPEMSMGGIELALEESLPRSLLYIFTDASAKDYSKLEIVQNKAIQKNIQVVFLLTGICEGSTDSDPEYESYHKLSAATSGQVFHLDKGDIGKILNYVIETIKDRKTIIASKTFAPGYNHQFNISVDGDMKSILVAESGVEPALDVTGPGGTKPRTETIVDLPQIKSTKILDTKPGNYSIKLGSKSETHVMVSATTSIHFKHGFSSYKPSSLNVTSSQPIAGQKSYMSIELINPSNNAKLNSVQILDIDGNLIVDLPLTELDEKRKLYLTHAFDPPDSLFKLQVKGYLQESGTEFTRLSPTAIEAQKTIAKAAGKSPIVMIDQGTSVEVYHGKPLQILCKITGFPKPDTMWVDSNGNEVVSTVSTFSYPYEHINVLELKGVLKNEKYTCKASNVLGESSKEIEVKIFKEPPHINKTVSLIHAKVGEDVQVECRNLKGLPKPTIAWAFLSDDANIVDPMWQAKEVLVFKNISRDQAGIYYCISTNGVGQDQHKIVLNVEESPTIDHGSTHEVSRIGEKTTLACVAHGNPKPIVNWYHNGTLVPDSKDYHIYRDNSLRFDAAIEKQGKFSCVAKNKHGTARRSVKVDYVVPAMVKPPKESVLEVYVGDEIHLGCDATGYPSPNIKWKFYSYGSSSPGVLWPSDRSGTLILRDVQKFHDGYYTCIASNVGGATNMTYQIMVLMPAVIKKNNSEKSYAAVIGDLAVRIPCEASGYPQPDIIWKKNGLNLPSGSQWYDIKKSGTLVIKNIDSLSGGEYVCHAANKLGEDQQVYKVLVTDIVATPGSIDTVYLEEGDTKYMACDIPHTILDYVRWYKNGIFIADAELTLENVQLDDEGVYSCRVSTFANSTSGNGTRLIIGSKPKFEYDTEIYLAFDEGQFATLDCYASGKPTPEVSWEHDGKRIDLKTMVNKFKVSSSTLGTYRCLISNRYGFIERAFTVSSQDCYISAEEVTSDYQPLIINSSLTKLGAFESIEGTIKIPTWEYFLFHCPGGFVNFPRTDIWVSCQKGKIVVDNNIFEYSDLSCREKVIPQTRNTGRVCNSLNTETLEIGYQFLGDFFPTFEICLDHYKNTTIYAKQTMHRGNNYSKVEEVIDDDYEDIQKLYDCNEQLKSISAQLGRPFHSHDSCCFKDRKLVNPSDLLGPLPWRAAFTYLNTVPHWSSCDTTNWDSIEQRVRTIVSNDDDELTIWTGSIGQLSLLNYRRDYQPIVLYGVNLKQPVPEYLWKVIHNPKKNWSTAIIQVNVPNLDVADISKHILCKDNCEVVPWLRDLNLKDISRGYVYCCSLEDFETAFSFQLEGFQNSSFIPFNPV